MMHTNKHTQRGGERISRRPSGDGGVAAENGSPEAAQAQQREAAGCLREHLRDGCKKLLLEI